MRDLFWEYYRPSDEEFSRLWEEAMLVFDTNVLLHLYRYTPGTRNDLIKIIEVLQQRIWLPHQVGLEFSRNRISVIDDQNDIFSLIKVFDTFVEEKFKKYIQQKYGKRGHFFADLNKIQTIFDQTKQALQDELDRARAEYPDPMGHEDMMLEHLDTLLQGRIGPPYPEEKLAQLSGEFERRYKQGTPPGFKDANKNKKQAQQKNEADKELSSQEDESSNPANKYGDVILWYQLIDYAKQEKRPIILVGDDGKEDWWQRIHGKTLGPRAELRREMREKANVLFYMYNFDNFLKQAQEFLQLQVQKETIEEVRKNRIQEAKLREKRTLANLNYPSSSLYPGPNVYPSIELSPQVSQQLEGIHKIINALGDEELKRQIRQDRQILEQIRQDRQFLELMLFLPSSGAPQENTENMEGDQALEDEELDQDNSSDDASDDSSEE